MKVFVRTYHFDDYISRLCYESWRAIGFTGEIIFYCQKRWRGRGHHGDYIPKWINGIGTHIFHDEYDDNNYGGANGATCLINGLKRINIHEEDFITICDADIIMKSDPRKLMEDCDVLGTGSTINGSEWVHLSGQLQVYRAEVLNKIVHTEYERPDNVEHKITGLGVSMCDDVYMSCRVHELGARIKPISPTGVWQHIKLHDLEPREDWDKIINEI